MTRHLSRAELAALEQPAPKPTMTRNEKLRRWADLVERSERAVTMCHGLEHKYSPDSYRWENSPIEIAYNDKGFRDAGLTDDTVGAARQFFDLSLQDLHAFSCNCGGVIDNARMARRIRAMGTVRGALRGLLPPSRGIVTGAIVGAACGNLLLLLLSHL